MHVRPARPGDAAAIVAVMERLEPAELVVHVEAAERRDRLRRHLELDANAAWVAEVDGEVVGELALDRDSGTFGMSVAPEWRRRGVGSALFDAAAEWARRHGIERLEALVRPGNESGREFLARQGFVQDEAGELVALGRDV